MVSRLWAFAVWALVAASAVFWGLRLIVRAPVAPPYTVAVGEGGGAIRGDLSRLLGSAPVAPVAAAPEAASRFKLYGIVAPQNAGAGGASGVALIAVDGKMPKAFRVGSAVDGDLTLQSVSLRTVSIAGRGAAAMTLELPPPVAAATGTLPAGIGVAMPVPPIAAPYPQPGGPPPGMPGYGAPGAAPPGIVVRPEPGGATQ